jgi:Inner membrane protein YgaP-like, transmembrane domain
MTFINEGAWDRIIRIVAGIALGYAAWMTWPVSVMSKPGAGSIVFLVIGAVAFVTGVVGWCPVYALFDVSTKKRIGA